MKIFVIHSTGMVMDAVLYADALELKGHDVYVPGRDTEQIDTTEHQILKTNLDGIEWCDEAHVLWDLSSLGTIFDMGSAYALRKPIKVIRLKKHHWTKFIERYEGEYIL